MERKLIEWIQTRLNAHSMFAIVLYLMQQFVQINMQFVKMNVPRLDRLTALLEGLSPKVTLTSKMDGFRYTSSRREHLNLPWVAFQPLTWTPCLYWFALLSIRSKPSANPTNKLVASIFYSRRAARPSLQFTTSVACSKYRPGIMLFRFAILGRSNLAM